MSNYPAGVSDNHPYFNPPREVSTAVECGADSALVVPSFAVRQQLNDLSNYVNNLRKFHPEHGEMLMSIHSKVGRALNELETLEQESDYECPFKGEVDLEESECARWDCPVCGNERETDNLPEERDPDYEYDRRGDDD